MCGIYGLLGTDARQPADTDLLRRMDDSLVHRGPDGGGVYTDGALGMGMRRLSIIDLATGDQPMANEDGSVWVVFNGEIYNYREVRSQLLARGHTFRTASDTEILVHLWEEDGEACVQRLRGMFAFAIWDRSTSTLFLARDRVGIKPLFYAPTAQGVVFGSELKALTLSPWVERRIDLTAVSAYLQYGYVPDPYTILQTVVKLPPGHTLTVRDGRVATPRRYWTPTPFFSGRVGPLREAEAVAALDVHDGGDARVVRRGHHRRQHEKQADGGEDVLGPHPPCDPPQHDGDGQRKGEETAPGKREHDGEKVERDDTHEEDTPHGPLRQEEQRHREG